jgi:hypothetical protein
MMRRMTIQMPIYGGWSYDSIEDYGHALHCGQKRPTVEVAEDAERLQAGEERSFSLLRRT